MLMDGIGLGPFSFFSVSSCLAQVSRMNFQESTYARPALNKTGVISGFVFGEMVVGGVIATLRYLNPNDDVAGVVIITFLVSGLFFAFVGYLIQKYLGKRRN